MRPARGDDTIAAIADHRGDRGAGRAHHEMIEVTADRERAERVRTANAEVVGPSWLLHLVVE
jgi:hypothetical protein